MYGTVGKYISARSTKSEFMFSAPNYDPPVSHDSRCSSKVPESPEPAVSTRFPHRSTYIFLVTVSPTPVFKATRIVQTSQCTVLLYLVAHGMTIGDDISLDDLDENEGLLIQANLNGQVFDITREHSSCLKRILAGLRKKRAESAVCVLCRVDRVRDHKVCVPALMLRVMTVIKLHDSFMADLNEHTP